MSKIVTREGFVAETWPETGVTVTFEALWSGQDLPLNVPLALDFDATTQAADLAPWLDKIALIRVPFGSFSDGRGFSLARQLRMLGYGGRLRAVGPLLADQFRAALRVGFDEVEIPDTLAGRQPQDHWTAVRHNPGYQDRLNAA